MHACMPWEQCQCASIKKHSMHVLTNHRAACLKLPEFSMALLACFTAGANLRRYEQHVLASNAGAMDSRVIEG
eukprot:scaffold79027_cov21-Tisochrysis_lutea.AAC.2